MWVFSLELAAWSYQKGEWSANWEYYGIPFRKLLLRKCFHFLMQSFKENFKSDRFLEALLFPSWITDVLTQLRAWCVLGLLTTVGVRCCCSGALYRCPSLLWSWICRWVNTKWAQVTIFEAYVTLTSILKWTRSSLLMGLLRTDQWSNYCKWRIGGTWL